MENTVDFDVEISLNYVLDNAEFKKHEEEVLRGSYGKRSLRCLFKTFKNQITLTKHKKTFHKTKE